MCGIAGAVSFFLNKNTQTTLLHKWQTLLRHRGPDDWGYYCNPTETLAGSVTDNTWLVPDT